ncbi:MAG TPA: DUF58 domain-containing protein [Methylophilaceae bacterium]|nr:DUF58 domain-containing protein [Methylophilaceae bacterium]
MATVFRFSRWKQWLRTARANQAPAVLSRRHIYILPTRFGVVFMLMLICMLVGSINYTLSLGFVVTFLLAGMGTMAMLHTWRNLAHLEIESRRAEPVFAGEDAIFEVVVTETRRRDRYAIAAHFEGDETVYADIAASGETFMRLPVRSRIRGWLKPGRVTFYTEFPLSLFHVWSYVELDTRCLIYPHPLSHSAPVPASADLGAAGTLDARSGDDDFAGHRTYQLGDSPRRVDWKASSREQGLFTKQFQGEAKSSLWFDWTLAPGTNAEQRIQQLTRWVVDAHHEHQSYGLRLPGEEFPPSTGEAHYRACLSALALMEVAA